MHGCDVSLEKVSEGEVYHLRKAHNALARIDNSCSVAVVVVDARKRAAVHGLNALDVHVALALLGALMRMCQRPGDVFQDYTSTYVAARAIELAVVPVRRSLCGIVRAMRK